MSVIEITRLHSSRTANYAGDGKREYEWTFRVETDDPDDGPLSAEIAVANLYSIVQNFTVYQDWNGTYDLAALAESIEASPEDDEYPLLWIVKVKFSTRVYDEIARKGGTSPASPHPPGDSGNQTENPLLQPADISFDFEIRNIARHKDLLGVDVVNSAGDRFDPPLEFEISILVITISRNEASYDRTTNYLYHNSYNDGVFLGFDPHTVKCLGIKGQAAYWNNFQYAKVTYVFHVGDWDTYHAVLDHGPKQMVGGKKVDCMRNGVPSDELLDGAGVQLGAAGVPVYLDFTFLRARDFSLLNLE